MIKKLSKRENELLEIIAADNGRVVKSRAIKEDILIAPWNEDVTLGFSFPIGDFPCIRTIRVPRDLANKVLGYIEDWSVDDRTFAEQEFDRL